MDEIIYMPLLDDETDTWRPVRGERMADGKYRILDEPDDAETWTAGIGDIVSCEWKVFSGGESGWVVTTS